MTRDGAQPLACRCGAVFRTSLGHARHQDAIPLYCRPPKDRARNRKGPPGTFTPRKSRAKAAAT